MNALRRLPWQDNGKDAYTPQGSGIVNAIADAMETSILVTSREDARRAQALAADSAASRAELRMAVQYLVRAVEDAAMVADLRGERLGIDSEEDAVRRSAAAQFPAVATFLASERDRDER
ncbi:MULTISPECIES: hypothetical protein [unclassified Streptomyces]|uniref:hypothetical protein n=1 Tax=unclassified Streptomyces TaxID=2593676 RepID=UPI003D8F80AE